jgi:hypothetical protein
VFDYYEDGFRGFEVIEEEKKFLFIFKFNTNLILFIINLLKIIFKGITKLIVQNFKQINCKFSLNH